MKEVPVTAAPPIRITGRGQSISIMQAGCRIVLSDQDVLPVFDAVAEVVADNRGFAEQHHKARHNRKPRKRETEQHADAE